MIFVLRSRSRQDLLKSVVQAFLDAEPEALVEEVVDHMGLHKVLVGKWYGLEEV